MSKLEQAGESKTISPETALLDASETASNNEATRVQGVKRLHAARIFSRASPNKNAPFTRSDKSGPISWKVNPFSLPPAINQMFGSPAVADGMASSALWTASRLVALESLM